MLVKTYCVAVNGLEVTTVTVEVSVEPGQLVRLSGLGDEAVRESQSRIRAAFLYSSFIYPNCGITINLAPADLKKEGTVFDLPVAVGILAANNIMPNTHLHEYMIVGELGLDGNLLPIKGALPTAIRAAEEGCKGIILPIANAREATVVENIEVYGVETLRDVVEFLSDNITLTPMKYDFRKDF